MPRLEQVVFSQSQDAVPPPQQAAVVPDRKTVTPLPADDSGKRKIPLGAGGNKQSSNNTQQKKKAKTQKKKKEKDPNQPKKKKNAYDFWAEVARNNLPPNNTDVKVGWQGKMLGVQWRAMSRQEKAPYERMASQDNIRWQEEMKAYKEANSKNNGPDEKKAAAKNVEGTIQLASMPAVSNPAVEGQRHKALARAMGKEDTNKNPPNAKGTTTEFINAKVVNNNSNDAPLPTGASQKSIESVDVDVLVEDPSSQEGMKLTKAPIKKGSSITTNNGNKENNNNGSTKAAAGKGGGLMASAKSGVTRLFNKEKSEGGMDKVNGKDGAQKKKLDEEEASQQPTEPSNDDDDDNTQQSEDLLGGCQDEETPVAANTSNHDKTASLDLPQAPSVLAKLTLTPMKREECASALKKLKGRPHEQPNYLSPVPERDENTVRKTLTLEKKEEDVAGLYKLTLGRSSTTAIKSTLISRSLCTVSMSKGDAATASVAMLKEPDGHAVFLNGDPLNEPVGKEIKLRHDDILSLYGPAGFAYRVQLSQ